MPKIRPSLGGLSDREVGPGVFREIHAKHPDEILQSRRGGTGTLSRVGENPSQRWHSSHGVNGAER